MNTRTRQSARLLASLGVAVLAASAALAFGDCHRAGRASEALNASSAVVPAEGNVSMSDPALDGMFARYADLHRDAVGYALVDVVESPVYANAAPVTPAPLAR